MDVVEEEHYSLEPYTLERRLSQNSTASVSFEIDVDGTHGGDGPEGVPMYQWDLMRTPSGRMKKPASAKETQGKDKVRCIRARVGTFLKSGAVKRGCTQKLKFFP